MRTALLAGSTGLIGRQLLQMLLESVVYSKVIALTRQDLPSHPKLVQVRVQVGSIVENASSLRADDVFCCLGTTMAKAGSKEKFYEIDFEYPVELARITHSLGATRYLLVSALGANKNSSIYYNRVKGETEEAISAIGFDSVHIFRPSLLLGARTEKRSGEDAAKFFYKVFGFLIPKKYQAIESSQVAAAMLHFAVAFKNGKFIHESVEMLGFPIPDTNITQ
jgi:uncharacterized protein YbjT (DUF2867 family)